MRSERRSQNSGRARPRDVYKRQELDEGDEVVDMSVVEDGAQVLSITENGYGKRTEIDEYLSLIHI